MTIGILALQGGFDLHKPHCASLNLKVRDIHFPQDCMNVKGYIIPGGESSVMLKLIHLHGLHAILQKEWEEKPV